jgi:NTP pyrophosphatase (non-canonical NTP hydrolase)
MCDERGFSKHSVESKFVKLLEELGEFAQAAAKKAGLSVSKERKAEIAAEAADVFIVFLGLCDKLDIDLEAAFRDKEEKNKKRVWK